MLRWLFRTISTLLIAAVLLFAGVGIYIGNTAYEQFRGASWDKVLGIENHSRSVNGIRRAEQRYDWDAVHVTAADGTDLRGTYIEDANDSRKTVILLHGLYQNRTMCLPYIGMYRNLGYNVLLVDLRGHGESGGEHTDWGLSEMSDLDAWVQWLKKKNPSGTIGMHGVSLGAAMALLYSGTDQGRELSFYVADSSYGNLTQLGREKVFEWAQDKRAIWGFNVLNPFFQASMYYHTRKTLNDIEPMKAVRRTAAPVLFLHGDADELIPVETVHRLYDQCRSPHKQIHIFSGSAHAVGISTDREEYVQTVETFLTKR
jgi:alpha-beta hydrolase superfamily lysophospholipase